MINDTVKDLTDKLLYSPASAEEFIGALFEPLQKQITDLLDTFTNTRDLATERIDEAGKALKTLTNALDAENAGLYAQDVKTPATLTATQNRLQTAQDLITAFRVAHDVDATHRALIGNTKELFELAERQLNTIDRIVDNSSANVRTTLKERGTGMNLADVKNTNNAITQLSATAVSIFSDFWNMKDAMKRVETDFAAHEKKVAHALAPDNDNGLTARLSTLQIAFAKAQGHDHATAGLKTPTPLMRKIKLKNQ